MLIAFTGSSIFGRVGYYSSYFKTSKEKVKIFIDPLVGLKCHKQREEGEDL